MTRRIHCQHCGNPSHNKRTCPVLTSRYQMRFESHFNAAFEYRKLYSKAGDPASYNEGEAEKYRALITGRTGIDPETGIPVTKKAAKAARMKGRKCTYCQYLGHTRRTCDVLSEDIEVLKVATKLVRHDYVDLLRTYKFNKGTLAILPVHSYGWGSWTKRDVPHLITSFLWDECPWSLRLPNQCIIELKALSSNVPEADRYQRFSLNKLRHVLVGGQVTVSSCAIEPPAGWADGHSADPLKTYFPLNRIRSTEFTWARSNRPDDVLSRARVILGLPDPPD